MKYNKQLLCIERRIMEIRFHLRCALGSNKWKFTIELICFDCCSEKLNKTDLAYSAVDYDYEQSILNVNFGCSNAMYPHHVLQ